MNLLTQEMLESPKYEAEINFLLTDLAATYNIELDKLADLIVYHGQSLIDSDTLFTMTADSEDVFEMLRLIRIDIARNLGFTHVEMIEGCKKYIESCQKTEKK